MSISRKYNRTYHFPFSPGTTSDDRINHEYWKYIQEVNRLIITEKLDGENTCLNQYGVFARSHAAPTTHPWANYLKEFWNGIKDKLNDLEIFGENLYAVHSIFYEEMENHFYIFAVRYKDEWLSWEDVCFYAEILGLPTVPVLKEMNMKLFDQVCFETEIIDCVSQPGIFKTFDVISKESCNMEGVVARNAAAFFVEDFYKNVFKYVRFNHVKTDVHWRRNWCRAALKWEKNVEINK